MLIEIRTRWTSPPPTASCMCTNNYCSHSRQSSHPSRFRIHPCCHTRHIQHRYRLSRKSRISRDSSSNHLVHCHRWERRRRLWLEALEPCRHRVQVHCHRRCWVRRRILFLGWLVLFQSQCLPRRKVRNWIQSTRHIWSRLRLLLHRTGLENLLLLMIGCKN